jgi:hypothetical protein
MGVYSSATAANKKELCVNSDVKLETLIRGNLLGDLDALYRPAYEGRGGEGRKSVGEFLLKFT